jgi:hypothetical protein
MTTTTRPRNYRKNPHTASFLQVFHTATGTNGRNYREEMNVENDDAAALALEAAEDDDLLNLVSDAPADLRTPGQIKFMTDLVARIAALDPATGETARAYTEGMTERGLWTAGRNGNASRWIDNMINKEKALRAAAPVATTPAAPAVEIPAGRYAVETDEIRCYTVDYGKAGTRWEGFLFLNRISSDDRFPVKNPAAKAEILAAIRADVEASAILAGLTLRQCRRCGRELSDTKNPYFSVALGPDCGTK